MFLLIYVTMNIKTVIL